MPHSFGHQTPSACSLTRGALEAPCLTVESFLHSAVRAEGSRDVRLGADRQILRTYSVNLFPGRDPSCDLLEFTRPGSAGR